MAVTLAQFIERLEASRILADRDLAAIRKEIAAEDGGGDAEPTVKRLHREGHITAYQAKAIWKGQGGKLSFGNYIIEDELGRGGMGVVLKARHTRMQRHVAIKVLPAAMVKDADAIARFQREVVAAAQLMHPNIVGAFDADVIDGQQVLVMEFVDGQDLASVVKKRGPLSVEKAIDCVIQVARGLEFAHKRGVVHRDIKPSNLLLDGDGNVKILDMGLARFAGSADIGTQAQLTGTGTVMGTVDYMSPEQALSTKDADARSDIYSLGMTLYVLLTGQPAYLGDSLMSRMLAHAQRPIPKITDARPDVPGHVQSVFAKMVAKSPLDRHQTMTEALAELESCRTSGTGTALISSTVDSAGSDSMALTGPFVLENDEAPTGGRTRVATSQPTFAPTLVDGEQTVSGEPTSHTIRTGGPIRGVRSKARRAKSCKAAGLLGDWRVYAGSCVGIAVIVAVFSLLRPPRDTADDGIAQPDSNAVGAGGDTVEVPTVAVGEDPDRNRPTELPTEIILEHKLPAYAGHMSDVGFPAIDRVLTVYVNGVVQICDVATGSEIHSFPMSVSGAADVSADGRLIVVGGGGEDGTIPQVQLWDAETAELRWTQEFAGGIQDFRFSAGTVLVRTRDEQKNVVLLDIETGEAVGRLPRYDWVSCAPAMSPDGRQIFLSLNQGNRFRILPIDDETSALNINLPSTASICAGVWSSDGQYIIMGDVDGTLRVVDANSGEVVRQWSSDSGLPHTLVVDAEGRLFCGGVGAITIWDWTDATLLARVDTPNIEGVWLAVSPDGKRLVSGGGFWWEPAGGHNSGDFAPRIWLLPENVWPTNPPPPSAAAPFGG